MRKGRGVFNFKSGFARLHMSAVVGSSAGVWGMCGYGPVGGDDPLRAAGSSPVLEKDERGSGRGDERIAISKQAKGGW